MVGNQKREVESGEEGQLKVTDVVKQLYSSRACAVDEIRPEFLKPLEVVGLPWLTCLCNVVRRSGVVQGGPEGVLYLKRDQTSQFGEESSKLNLRFRRNNVVFVLVLELWTSSLSFPGY